MNRKNFRLNKTLFRAMHSMTHIIQHSNTTTTMRGQFKGGTQFMMIWELDKQIPFMKIDWFKKNNPLMKPHFNSCYCSNSSYTTKSSSKTLLEEQEGLQHEIVDIKRNQLLNNQLTNNLYFKIETYSIMRMMEKHWTF